jgi:hypothetical protein
VNRLHRIVPSEFAQTAYLKSKHAKMALLRLIVGQSKKVILQGELAKSGTKPMRAMAGCQSFQGDEG